MRDVGWRCINSTNILSLYRLYIHFSGISQRLNILIIILSTPFSHPLWFRATKTIILLLSLRCFLHNAKKSCVIFFGRKIVLYPSVEVSHQYFCVFLWYEVTHVRFNLLSMQGLNMFIANYMSFSLTKKEICKWPVFLSNWRW